MKRELTATTEWGVFTRTTHHDYVVVNVYRKNTPGRFGTSWHKTPAAAAKAAGDRYNRERYVGTYPVDGGGK